MIWKKIEGYDYSINEAGECRNNVSGRILKPSICARYLTVTLTANGEQNSFGIHRLLGMCFLSCRPPMQVDHIDGNPLNNDLSNLRVITRCQNQWNRKGTKGYTQTKSTGKWIACIIVNGKNIGLGTHATEEEAHAAYLQAKAIYHVIPSLLPE